MEQFEIFDETGQPCGLALRGRVHREGLWHRSVNVFLFRSDGRLLLQRRHESKDVCPGAWDISVAEHLKPGESYEEAARRGLAEELGINPPGVTPIGDIARSQVAPAGSNVRDYELQKCFRVVSDEDVVLASDEVADWCLIELDALRRAFPERPDDYTPWLRQRAVELGFVQPALSFHRS